MGLLRRHDPGICQFNQCFMDFRRSQTADFFAMQDLEDLNIIFKVNQGAKAELGIFSAALGFFLELFLSELSQLL